ncbi:hypothetical protein [Streptomyces neyagawaensis]|uniref:hypothetical protein n=1 Tax=Streptomyces neyagawaensis TaxID=42238 RepID=UPI0006E14C76|nr:hypothetical protein [Streptomyces neyagawaensis]MCL6732994.1 hypothetical protein [Streptomyces neyagawaensis]MDE1684855.1 hypothetical protein [Streptomyces neyagawaensis]
MVSSSHEVLHQICQKDTEGMIRSFRRLFHVPFPEPRVISVVNTDLTEIAPVERRVDSLVRVDTDEGDFLLVLESQGKRDERKRGSWPYYLSYLHEKYGCQPVLIVMTQSRSTARWAAQPIRLGLPSWSSLVVRPLVLGPENVPVVADEAEVARDVTLAVFSAITHGRGPDAAAILEPLAAVLETVNPETASVFAELVESGLVDDQAKKVWRELMMTVNYFFKNPVAVKLREEGRVEERIASILRTLDRRHLDVPDSVRRKVRNCTDPDLLQVWADRAYDVTDAADLFDSDET